MNPTSQVAPSAGDSLLPGAGDTPEGLERQIERGSLHTHTALGASFSRLAEMQALVHGLTDVLLAKGVLSEQELAATVDQVKCELRARGEDSGPGLVIRIEPEPADEPPATTVDCAARMPVCQAVCCRLDFALSVSEIEAGHARWDLGRPYFIRHEQNGCCTHRGAAGGCAVYANRPGVCRRYSCEHDARIWKDFARRELNTEWIAAHLGESAGPRALGALMHVSEGDTIAVTRGECEGPP